MVVITLKGNVMRNHILSIVVLGIMIVALTPGFLQAVEVGLELNRLFVAFSRPDLAAASPENLAEIFRLLDQLLEKKRFQVARSFVQQLESSRIGRTPSLRENLNKQMRDSQMVDIWKFEKNFYSAWEAFERGRGLDVMADGINEHVASLTRNIEAAADYVQEHPGHPPEVFEDAPESRPYDAKEMAALVNIPTVFFLRIPTFFCPMIPMIVPFQVGTSADRYMEVGLNNTWMWNIANWKEVSSTVISGMAPSGQTIVWVAGPMADQRRLTCFQAQGHWIIAAGDRIEVSQNTKRFSLFPDAKPEASISSATLRSRGFAGFSYVSPEKPKPSPTPGDPGGLLVRKVFPATPAAKGGLQMGDLIVEYGGVPIHDESAFKDALLNSFAGQEVRVTVRREGQTKPLRILLAEPPQESAPDLDIEYTSFLSGKTRLRSVLVSPKGSSGRKLPGLYLVSALGSSPIRGYPGHSMMREVAFAAARKGFRVFRFELRGSGDSEGEDYRTTDFLTEVGDNEAGLKTFSQRGDVDGPKVIVFGHSTGGLIAALLADRVPVAGVILSCTVGRSYLERVLESVRHQGRLAGDKPDLIDASVKSHAAMLTAMLQYQHVSPILSQDPRLKEFINQHGRVFDDRTVQYWHQKLNLNLAKVYGAVRCPALIIWCKSDFITTRTCHEWIRDILREAGNLGATLTVIPGVDHRYAQARSAKESFQGYKSGMAKCAPEPIKAIVNWLESR